MAFEHIPATLISGADPGGGGSQGSPDSPPSIFKCPFRNLENLFFCIIIGPRLSDYFPICYSLDT